MLLKRHVPSISRGVCAGRATVAAAATAVAVTALLLSRAAAAESEGCARLQWTVLSWNDVAISLYQSSAVAATPMAEWRIFRLYRADMHRTKAAMRVRCSRGSVLQRCRAPPGVFLRCLVRRAVARGVNDGAFNSPLCFFI